MSGVSKKAVIRLLCEAGTVCAEYQDRVLRNLPTKRLQLDEIWSWIYCKKANKIQRTVTYRTVRYPYFDG
jgi:hypothetical protein